MARERPAQVHNGLKYLMPVGPITSVLAVRKPGGHRHANAAFPGHLVRWTAEGNPARITTPQSDSSRQRSS